MKIWKMKNRKLVINNQRGTEFERRFFLSDRITMVSVSIKFKTSET